MNASDSVVCGSSDGSSQPDEPLPSSCVPAREAGSLVVELLDATSELSHAQVHALTGLATDAIVEAVKRAGLGTEGGEVLVRIVDDAEMTRVHEEFLEDATTTDVITFDLTNGGSSEGERLDINAYVCLDEAKRQSGERGHDVLHELTLYVLHAALHCLGENDATDEAYTRMHAREDEVLSAIGLGALFAGDGSVAADGGAS